MGWTKLSDKIIGSFYDRGYKQAENCNYGFCSDEHVFNSLSKRATKLKVDPCGHSFFTKSVVVDEDNEPYIAVECVICGQFGIVENFESFEYDVANDKILNMWIGSNRVEEY